VEPLVPLDPDRALKVAAHSRLPIVARYIVRRAASEQTSLAPLVAAIASADDATRHWMLAETLTALATRGRMAAPQAWQAGYEALARSPSERVRQQAELVAVRLGDGRALPKLRETVADREAEGGPRREALAALVNAKDPELPACLHRLLDDPVLAVDAIRALASFDDPATAAVLIDGYDALPVEAQQAAIATLVARPASTIALLDAIGANKLPRSQLSAFTVGQLTKVLVVEVQVAPLPGQQIALPASEKHIEQIAGVPRRQPFSPRPVGRRGGADSDLNVLAGPSKTHVHVHRGGKLPPAAHEPLCCAGVRDGRNDGATQALAGARRRVGMRAGRLRGAASPRRPRVAAGGGADPADHHDGRSGLRDLLPRGHGPRPRRHVHHGG
jgi:hypothetical protein